MNDPVETQQEGGVYVVTLAESLARALREEHAARVALHELQARAEREQALLLYSAYNDGTLDGPNADARKRQEAVFLADSPAYQDLLAQVAEAETKAAHAEIERRQVEALIGLTRAWLYAQAGGAIR